MLALAHSSTSGNSALLLAILAAVAVVMFWRPLIKVGIILVVMLIVIALVTGLSVVASLVHQLTP
ncbi:MAG TPA: hypothetical protein VHZ03_57290 [Trebonia sp.]|jgi:hypothetical protein|nr:hypothetical protein [Trebonia sp.]